VVAAVAAYLFDDDRLFVCHGLIDLCGCGRGLADFFSAGFLDFGEARANMAGNGPAAYFDRHDGGGAFDKASITTRRTA
jgi:hypothetical protein